MHTVLVVEDEMPVRVLMMRWLMNAGHAVIAAGTAAEALEEMARLPVALVVTDIVLPGRDGLWLAGEIRRGYPETVLIMATGSQDFHNAVGSLRHGAIDYLRKPFDRTDLVDAVQRGLAHYESAAAQRNRIATLELEVHTKEIAVMETATEARIIAGTAIAGMLGMLEAHAPGSQAHSERVARLTADTALLMGISNPLLSHIDRAALLHDLGRIALGTAEQTPGVAEASQGEHGQMVPELGARLMRKMPFLARACEIVLGVAERYDGSGHPGGLRGRQIPLGSRIIAIANRYDQLTHGVEGHDATVSSPAEALAALHTEAGTHFDPEVLAAFELAASLSAATTAFPSN